MTIALELQQLHARLLEVKARLDVPLPFLTERRERFMRDAEERALTEAVRGAQ